MLPNLVVAILCACSTAPAAASLREQRECRRQALAWHLLIPGFGFVGLTLAASFCILVLVFIISKVQADLTRNSTLPQSGTTKCYSSLDSLLWSTGWTHTTASFSAHRL
jgi:hypothetical protein